MTNTTWNPSDKTAGGTLSGGNLTFTVGSNSGVRTVDKQITGKFYWEYNCTTWTGFQTHVGIANAVATLSTVASDILNVCTTQKGSGNIWINGVQPPGSPTLGARTSGNIIGIAVDLNAKLAWFRVAPAGNWNGSGTANPATGVGGVSIAAISLDANIAPIYGLIAAVGAGDVITANFGDAAFSGAVPAGFTSGFTAGAVVPLIAVNTQIALEQWAIPNPQGQLTQIALEQWVSLGGSSGKYYFEVTATTIVGAGGPAVGVGVATTTSSYTGMGTNATAGVEVFLNGTIFANGVNTGLTIAAYTTGDVIGIAVDLDNRKAWFRKGAAGNWNGAAIGSQNPATITGGATIPAGSISPICTFGGTGGTTGNVFTGNFGASAFVGAVPAGFIPGWTIQPVNSMAWSASDRSNITLTNNNLTATANNVSGGQVRSPLVLAANTKYYWEYTVNIGSANSGVGFCLSTCAFSPGFAFQAGTAGIVASNGNIYINAVYQSANLGSPAANQVVGIAVDRAANLMWVRYAPSGNWNGSGTANPATGVGGFSISSIATGSLLPAFFAYVNTEVCTANFGASAFVGAVPSGFAGWPGLPTAAVFATWDVATLTDTALSNGNLTATHTTTNANSGARVLPLKSTGQFYFEIKLIMGNGSFDAMGLASAGITYNNWVLSGTNSVVVGRGGGININGVNFANIGAFAPNDVLGIAVDLTAHLVWCRRNAGTWNNSGTANPATAVGGLACPAVALAPIVCFVGTGTAINDAYTANFGATAFANVAPSGFAGWTA